MSHISTFANNTSLFNGTFRLQSNYATVQLQASSGLKSANSYEGIASDSQTLIGLNAQVATLNAQTNNIKNAQGIMNVMQSTTSSMSDLLDRTAAVLSSVLGLADASSSIAANITEQMTAFRTQMASLLNTQVGGRYIFGGSVQDQPVVNLNDPAYNTATPSLTVPDSNYYQGDNAAQTVRATDNLQLSYGVMGDNPAFEKALRAMNVALANPSDVTVLANCYTLVKEAIAGVADITGGLNTKTTLLSNELSYQSAAAGYLDDTISNLRDADVAAATVQATQIETQLQSSFSILSKVLNLRLSDYLK